jgi:hypothetical protein
MQFFSDDRCADSLLRHSARAFSCLQAFIVHSSTSAVSWEVFFKYIFVTKEEFAYLPVCQYVRLFIGINVTGRLCS